MTGSLFIALHQSEDEFKLLGISVATKRLNSVSMATLGMQKCCSEKYTEDTHVNRRRLSVENDVAAFANRLCNCVIMTIVTETLSFNEKPKMGLAGEGVRKRDLIKRMV